MFFTEPGFLRISPFFEGERLFFVDLLKDLKGKMMRFVKEPQQIFQ